MKHLGDITKIDWSAVEPVDVVTGGSPCQDLSVAGKRAGLAGERSGLYMEQIRCVKELREADVLRGRTGEFIRPRYMVWENVPGAFSSGKPKGADFAAVIEEIIKIAEPDAYVCVVPPSDRWTKSGCYYDSDGRWSIAWRVHDAQFWGVPQRRKRISLVADFGGLSAPEVLFVRKGLSGNFEQSGTERQRTAGCFESSIDGAISFQERAGKPGGGKGILIQPERTGALSTLNNQSVLCLNDQGGSVMSASVDVSGCLRAQEHGHQPIVAGFSTGQGEKAGGIGWREEQAPMINAEQQSAVFAFQQNASGEVRQSPVGYTISTNSNPSGRNSPLCYDARGNGDGETVCTLTGDHRNRVTDYTAIVATMQGFGNYKEGEVASACKQRDYKDATDLVAGLDCRNGRENGDLCGTLQSKPNGGFSYNCIHPVRCANTVRRLTPLECERLQGYPDGWTDIGEWVDTKGKKHKEADSPRYKALGNSIALPFWCWLARRISAQYERDITMGSLFDGIGGFPYAFEKCGGKALWASEIEEFPMAVTKIRFPEEDTNDA